MHFGLKGFGKTDKAVATTLLRPQNFEIAWVVCRSVLVEQCSAGQG